MILCSHDTAMRLPNFVIKNDTFVPLQMKECATKRNWHRAKGTKNACKRHEKTRFSLIDNARVCYNAFGEVILCKTLASKKT